MTKKKVLLVVVAVILGVIVVDGIVHLVWHIASAYQLSRKQENLDFRVDRQVIWNDPGSVSNLNFRWGPGGPHGTPAPPFDFLEEHTTGSSPSVSVKDAKGRTWRVKWGEEVHAETFATRLAWAAGYFADTTYFVPEGKILHTRNLQRAAGLIDENQNFSDARFELDEKKVVKRFDEYSWAWDHNPFVGTPELNGLKIMMMLTSNWDNKDSRDVSRGSNTAIFYYEMKKRRMEARYMVTDWGGSMGKWGSNIMTRGKWDCDGFLSQTPDFVLGVEKGMVLWCYAGQRTEDTTIGISVKDAAWLYRYVGSITDAQLEDGLRASGATDYETGIFVRALRNRIDQLKRVAGM